MRFQPVFAILIALGACAPSSPAIEAANVLCAPVHETSPVAIEEVPFRWRTVPAVLAPDESVVQAVRTGSRATIVHEIETEPTGGGERTRTCTRVYAVALHSFTVTGVVKGPLTASNIEIMQASQDSIGLDDAMFTPPDGAPGFLVVSPAKYPHVTSSVPVMWARPGNQDHPCFPTTGIAPAPGC